MESNEKNAIKRANSMFFLQTIGNNNVIDNILNLKGFDSINADENVVSLLITDNYENKRMLEEAVEKLNGMYLRDEQNRLVKVQLSLC